MRPAWTWLALKGIVKPSSHWSESDRFVVWDSLKEWDPNNKLMTADFARRVVTSTFAPEPNTAYADFLSRR